MCYQGISGNIFNEQFFLYLPNILSPWKKKKEKGNENKSKFSAMTGFHPFWI